MHTGHFQTSSSLPLVVFFRAHLFTLLGSRTTWQIWFRMRKGPGVTTFWYVSCVGLGEGYQAQSYNFFPDHILNFTKSPWRSGSRQKHVNNEINGYSSPSNFLFPDQFSHKKCRHQVFSQAFDKMTPATENWERRHQWILIAVPLSLSKCNS